MASGWDVDDPGSGLSDPGHADCTTDKVVINNIVSNSCLRDITQGGNSHFRLTHDRLIDRVARVGQYLVKQYWKCE